MSAWQRPTLPGPCGPSTIGAGRLNVRVRDGYAWFPSAIITKPVFVQGDLPPENWMRNVVCCEVLRIWISPRPISIRQLHVLPRFHPEPINHVVYMGSSSRE